MLLALAAVADCFGIQITNTPGFEFTTIASFDPTLTSAEPAPLTGAPDGSSPEALRLSVASLSASAFSVNTRLRLPVGEGESRGA